VSLCRDAVRLCCFFARAVKRIWLRNSQPSPSKLGPSASEPNQVDDMISSQPTITIISIHPSIPLTQITLCDPVWQCFSTGVPQNPRVPAEVSNGSARPLVLSKKINCIRLLQPLDAFSRFLIGPKCICSRGSAPNSAGEAYSDPPDPQADGEGVRCPLSKNPSPALGLETRPSGPQESPKRYGICEQSKLLQEVPLH